MKTLTSIIQIYNHNKTQKGFTLIELLVVLIIVGTFVSIITININSVMLPQSQIILNKIKKQIKFSKQWSKINNIIVNLEIKEKQITAYYLNSETQKWLKNKNIPIVKWQDIIVMADKESIKIFPNGFITLINITVKEGDESYTLNTDNEN